MKPTSKMSVAASSPGRADKLPAPPFSRLLKGKTASRSRRSSSSSRASPMFVVRRRSAGEGEGEKDPGSPKVTCIGQVRIHKKKKKKKKTTTMTMDNNNMDNNNKAGGGDDHNKNQHQRQTHSTSSSSCDCRCFHRPDFCNPFTKLPQTKRSRAPTPRQPPEDNQHRRRLWRGWFSTRCCHSSSSSSSSSSKRCHRESKDQKQLLQTTTPTPTATIAEDQDPPVQRTKPRVSFACSPVRRDWMSKVAADGDGVIPGDDDNDRDSDDPGVPSTPPKNALLLMRCRSAPQGASSPFTRRFLTPDHEPDPASTDDTDPDVPQAPAAAARSSPFFRFKTPSPDAAHRASTKSTENYNNTDDAGSTSEEDAEADAAAAAVGPSPSFSSVPLILTRCKSEPAHKAAKLASAHQDSTDDNNSSNGGSYCNSTSNTKGKEHRRRQ